MYDNGKTEIRRHAISNVRPGFSAVVRAIESPMILQEKASWTIRMQCDLVYALPEFGILIGHEHSADAAVLRCPCAPRIVGAVDATGGNCHVHALVVSRVEHNAMQRQASITWHPAGTMRMIEQTTH